MADFRLVQLPYRALDLDFSLEVTGFDLSEIELLTDAVTPQPDNDDEVPGPQPGPAVSHPDDLWLLGPHRLYCGSALDERAYGMLMGDDRAAAVFTDPPYNVRIDGHASGLGAIRHREFAMASGEMAPDAYIGFLGQTCTLLTRYSRDGSIHYICMDWAHMHELLDATQPIYSELKNLCVWAKDNAGMGSFYRSQHELVFVFKHGPHQRRPLPKAWRHVAPSCSGSSKLQSSLANEDVALGPFASAISVCGWRSACR